MPNSNRVIIGGMAVRVLNDGVLWIPRRNHRVEKILDRDYIRIGSRVLQWVPRSEIWKDAGVFDGQTARIVGKGPSLDRLEADTLSAPVFVCNEAVYRAEKVFTNCPIFGVQMDAHLGQTGRPARATMLLKRGKTFDAWKRFPRKVAIDPREFHLPPSCLTAIVAIKIALLLGCIKLDMWAFDACVNQQTAYADCIGYASNADKPASRFLGHRALLEKAAGDLEINWRMP